MNQEIFISQFENCTLPKEQFTHEAHIFMAFYYLQHHPFPESLALIRDGIKNFAHHNNAQDLYHETLTFWYAMVINHRRLQLACQDWKTFKKVNSDLFSNTKSFLARYYLPETLQSKRAKNSFVLPDVQIY